MKKKIMLFTIPVLGLLLCGCEVPEVVQSTWNKTKGFVDEKIVSPVKDMIGVSDEGEGQESEDKPSGHVCEFETIWSTSETHHWHKCNDATCDEKSNYGEHDYDGVDWITVTPATETSKGQKKRACNVCGYEQFAEIPMLEHVHTFADTWSSDETGHWHAATCAHSDQTSDFAAHDYTGVNWVVISESTETVKGSHKRACRVCGYEEVEELPLLEHEHVYDAASWEHDETNHWNLCTATGCGEHINVAAHTFSDWAEKTAPTASADGVLARTCTVCGYEETKPILHKQFDVAYHFSETKDYTMTDTVYGLNMDVAGTCGDGYEGLYISMSSIKVEMASAYTFKIRNNGDSTLELRIGYRNSTTKVYAVSTNVEDYSITSEIGSSSTKVKSYKDGFVRFGIAAQDTADITVAIASQDYDQFIFLPVHANSTAVSLTVIRTGAITGSHNWSKTYSSDDEYHWLTCEDEGCTFISSKGKHDWVADTTKDDIPATSDQTGTAFKVCSVCGKTKEVEIPVIGAPTERDIDMMALGFASNSAYAVTAGENKLSVSYSMVKDSYDKMKVNVTSVEMTKLTSISLKLKNTGSALETFCVTAKEGSTYLIPNGATNLTVVSTELGTSSVERVGSTCAYLKVGAGDTVEYLIPTLAATSFSELSLFVKPDATKTGSFELYKFSVHDDFSGTDVEEEKTSAEVYGTWGGYSICAVTKNADNTSTVEYTQTNPATSGNLQLSDFASLISSYSGKTIKSMSVELTNLSAVRLHSCFQIKDNSGVISTTGSVTGNLTYDRHSSGSGEYFYLESSGSGTITAVLDESKTPTKVRLFVAHDQADLSGSFKIGKITLTF